MEEFEKKPDYVNKEQMYEAIGKVLWGKNGKPFSMRRLIFGFMKKKITGGKRK